MIYIPLQVIEMIPTLTILEIFSYGIYFTKSANFISLSKYECSI